jgi:deazaflavin-dependent oxidoreductase (nitroreductase family)
MRRIYAAIAVLIRRRGIGEAVKHAFSKSNLAVYRLSGGRLWNTFRRGQIMLLTTRGRHSGEPRVSPLVVVPWHEGWAIVGSNAGGAHHPAWVHNLRADPRAVLTIRTEEISVRGAEVDDEQVWREIFARFVAANEGYSSYVTKTSRHLPIFILKPTQERAT